MKCTDEISEDDLKIYEKYAMKLTFPFANLSPTNNLKSANSIPSELNDMVGEKRNRKEILSKIKNSACHNNKLH